MVNPAAFVPGKPGVRVVRRAASNRMFQFFPGLCKKNLPDVP